MKEEGMDEGLGDNLYSIIEELPGVIPEEDILSSIDKIKKAFK